MENKILFMENVLFNELGSPIDPNILKFRIKKIKVENNNNFMLTSADNKVASFQGFKLSLEQATSEQVENKGKMFVKRIEIKKQNTDEKQSDSSLFGVMNLERCQAACFENLNCRTYSFCQHSSECLISSTSFESKVMAEKLLLFKKSKFTTGERLKINEKVELIEARSCELFNKIYFNLFKKSYQLHLNTLEGLMVFKGHGEEKCAELCFEKSLKVMNEINSLNIELEQQMSLISLAKSSNELDASEAEEFSRKEEEIRRKYKEQMSLFCDYFLYLDTSLTDAQNKLLLEASLKNNNSKAHYNGTGSYCAIERKSTRSKLNATKGMLLNEKNLVFQSYRFDYTNLYERHYGFRMQDNKFDYNLDQKTLYETYEKFSSQSSKTVTLSSNLSRINSAPNEKDYQLMGSILSEGKNFQLKVATNELNCAQMCFEQTSSLWPACQSFDTVLVHRTSDESSDMLCFLNTLSLTLSALDVEKSSIRKNTNNNVQMWHYEPRFGLLRRQAEVGSKLSSSQTYLASISDTLVQYGSARLGKAIIFLIVAVGLASGLLFGVELARRVLVSVPAKDLSANSANNTLTNNRHNQSTLAGSSAKSSARVLEAGRQSVSMLPLTSSEHLNEHDDDDDDTNQV